jgi:hypothetical protein
MQLLGSDFKPYITSMLSCRACSEGYILEPNHSKLTLDFNSFKGKIKCKISLRRLGGNGKLSLKANDEVQFHDVLSKSHNIEFELNSNKVIEFTRDISFALGKMLLLGFYIELLEPNAAFDVINQKWKDVLSQCGAINGISYSNGKLYASESASIQKASIIDNIETDPVKSYINTDNVIKFINPCEIINVQFKSSDITSKQMYPHLPAPPKIMMSLEDINNQTCNDPVINSITNRVTKITGKTNTSIMYDSFQYGLNFSLLSNANDIVSGKGKNNKGLILNRAAEFCIPISGLEPNVQYVVVVNAKKINGNGKLWAAFTTSNGVQRESSIMICLDRDSEHYIKLNTNQEPEAGNTYMLRIFRQVQSAVGEILLDRIMVIQGINTVPKVRYPVVENYNQQSNNVSNSNVTFEDNDLVSFTAKKYSRYTQYKSDIKLNHCGSLITMDYSSLYWFNKIKPICPGLNLDKSKQANVLFGTLGNLLPAEKIWIDVFDNDLFSEKDDEILNNAKIIISPSFQNTEFLKNKYKNKEIYNLERSWPIVEPISIPFTKGEYVVAFHKNSKITNRIIEAYGAENPKLFIVGYRGFLPEHIYAFNEYVTYDKLLYLLMNSKLVIDISVYDEYLSSIVSLAHDIGIPVMTSNWLAFQKDNMKFMLLKDIIDGVRVPTVENFKTVLNEALKLNKINKDYSKHNNKLNELLVKLF